MSLEVNADVAIEPVEPPADFRGGYILGLDVGTLTIGSPEDELSRYDNETQHQVPSIRTSTSAKRR